MFINNQKIFFEKLRNTNSAKITNPPSQTRLENFWSSTLSTPSSHNKKAPWLQQEKLKNKNLQQDIWENITPVIFLTSLKKLMNWKSPGIDKVQNYWIKKLTALHTPLMNALNKICNQPTLMPTWLTQGYTTLIRKKGCESDPKNYRPITCLPTTYKFLTLILSTKIYNHITKSTKTTKPILQVEQKGFKKKITRVQRSANDR